VPEQPAQVKIKVDFNSHLGGCDEESKKATFDMRKTSIDD